MKKSFIFGAVVSALWLANANALTVAAPQSGDVNAIRTCPSGCFCMNGGKYNTSFDGSAMAPSLCEQAHAYTPNPFPESVTYCQGPTIARDHSTPSTYYFDEFSEFYSSHGFGFYGFRNGRFTYDGNCTNYQNIFMCPTEYPKSDPGASAVTQCYRLEPGVTTGPAASKYKKVYFKMKSGSGVGGTVTPAAPVKSVNNNVVTASPMKSKAYMRAAKISQNNINVVQSGTITCPAGCFCMNGGVHADYIQQTLCNDFGKWTGAQKMNAQTMTCEIRPINGGGRLIPRRNCFADFSDGDIFIEDFSEFYLGDFGYYGYKNGKFTSFYSPAGIYSNYVIDALVCPQGYPRSEPGAKAVTQCYTYKSDMNGNKTKVYFKTGSGSGVGGTVTPAAPVKSVNNNVVTASPMKSKAYMRAAKMPKKLVYKEYIFDEAPANVDDVVENFDDFEDFENFEDFEEFENFEEYDGFEETEDFEM